jgi:hypothetical protein
MKINEKSLKFRAFHMLEVLLLRVQDYSCKFHC